MSPQDPYGPSTGPLRSPAPPPCGRPDSGGAYGPPGWEEPGYGQHGHPAAGSPPLGLGHGYDLGPQRTNVMAILGLVLAFVFSPLGIVFSAIGLGQVGRRGEKGRGLALTGLIVSIVLLVVGVLVVVLGSPAFRNAVGSARASASSAAAEASDGVAGAAPSGTDAGAAPGGDDAGVASACRTIVPALMNLEAGMQDVRTPAEYSQALPTLESTMTAAAGGASDPQFRQDIVRLNADLEQASAAVRSGQDPSSVASALNADGEAVGEACMAAGYTD